MRLCEINTRCWLRQSNFRNLAQVPSAQLETWRRQGFEWIWLMGVWQTGPLAAARACRDAVGQSFFSNRIPPGAEEGWTEADVGASPYAISAYEVSEEVGGEFGLAAFRKALHRHGLKLMLDFVPNHLGVDHPWIEQHPGLFVQSPQPAKGFFERTTSQGQLWLAHGKDPYFAPWSDTVQLDYRRPQTRETMAQLMASVASRCDGVRCDMAMLLLNEVFVRTWGPLAGQPEVEFWPTAIRRVRQEHPEFVFLAEVYWGLEPRLQELGFDFTYDKGFFDAVMAHDAAAVHRHLYGQKPLELARGMRFLENHDETRSALRLSGPELEAAATLLLSLPGASLIYEGQLEGWVVQQPVQMLRRLAEKPRPDIESFYRRLLQGLAQTRVGQGRGGLLEPLPAGEGNLTAQNVVAIQWLDSSPGLDLAIVNLASSPSQCRLLLPPAGPSHGWRAKDLLSDDSPRNRWGNLRPDGLFVDLPAFGTALLQLE